MKKNEVIEILELIDSFPQVDGSTKIDLFCAIQRLKGSMPQKIRKDLIKFNTTNLGDAKQRLTYFTNNKDSFSRLLTKVKKNPISIFRTNKDFLTAFFSYAPSPIDVHLPFHNWDYDLLKHYLKIVFKTSISERTLRDFINSTKKYDDNPLLTKCRNLDVTTDFFLLVNRLHKISSQNKYSDFLPLLINCKTLENSSLNLYKNDPQKNNIYDIAIRHLPKRSNLDQTVFLVTYTEKREVFFRDCFFHLDKIPKVSFVFCKMSDLKKIAEVNTQYMDKFYNFYSSLRKKLNGIGMQGDKDSILRNYKKVLNNFDF